MKEQGQQGEGKAGDPEERYQPLRYEFSPVNTYQVSGQAEGTVDCGHGQTPPEVHGKRQFRGGHGAEDQHAGQVHHVKVQEKTQSGPHQNHTGNG